jgi:DNA-directed RNA polymerase subunit M/transcription elongation factor TFIIS
MEFCNHCQNMLYIKDDDNHSVKLYCKNCTFEKPLAEDEKSKLVLQNFYKSDINIHNVFNKNIEYDKTIPHIDNISCPNKDCTKPKNQTNDIMFMNTDSINLKYVYYCVYCKHFWENA